MFEVSLDSQEAEFIVDFELVETLRLGAGPCDHLYSLSVLICTQNCKVYKRNLVTFEYGK